VKSHIKAYGLVPYIVKNNNIKVAAFEIIQELKRREIC